MTAWFEASSTCNFRRSLCASAEIIARFMCVCVSAVSPTANQLRQNYIYLADIETYVNSLSRFPVGVKLIWIVAKNVRWISGRVSWTGAHIKKSNFGKDYTWEVCNSDRVLWLVIYFCQNGTLRKLCIMSCGLFFCINLYLVFLKINNNYYRNTSVEIPLRFKAITFAYCL